jgi:hypothetical protein
VCVCAVCVGASWSSIQDAQLSDTCECCLRVRVASTSLHAACNCGFTNACAHVWLRSLARFHCTCCVLASDTHTRTSHTLVRTASHVGTISVRCIIGHVWCDNTRAVAALQCSLVLTCACLFARCSVDFSPNSVTGFASSLTQSTAQTHCICRANSLSVRVAIHADMLTHTLLTVLRCCGVTCSQVRVLLPDGCDIHVLSVNTARVSQVPAIPLSPCPAFLRPHTPTTHSPSLVIVPINNTHSYSLLRDWCYPHSCAYCQRSSSVCCTTTIISHTHTHTHSPPLACTLNRTPPATSPVPMSRSR